MGRLLRVSIVAGVVIVLAGTMDESFTPEPLPPLPAQARVAEKAPEPPRERVEIPAVTRRGPAVHVAADGNLQQAIDAAQPGTIITLEPGATYRGPFQLRRKSGDGWITIMTASDRLPAAGTRVSPSHATLMPKLVSDGDYVMTAEPGAHHYRLIGLEIAPLDGTYVTSLLQFGDAERALDQVPHHLIVERSYLHGDPQRGARRGIALNSAHSAVIDSHLSDFKEAGADSQAIAGWNGPGPFRIAGNYLEGAGENVMFGGADPLIAGLVPADIEVVRNHFAKPLRWKKDDPSFEGTEWTVKNLFELKNARRVLVDGNVLEYNWTAAQNGFAILFTVRNQDGAAPWSQVEDVVFSNNLVRHVGGGINMLGEDDNQRSQPTRRIAIRNNLFLDVGGQWGDGRLFQLLDGVDGVTIEQNTALHTGSILFGGDHDPHAAFVFQNNIVLHNEHGITASGTGTGMPTLQRYFPGATVRGNIIVGAERGLYPADNFFPASIDALGNRVVGRGEFRLALAPAFARQGAGGRDPGVDAAALAKALSGLARLGLGSAS